jgi:hypothetical protein
VKAKREALAGTWGTMHINNLAAVAAAEISSSVIYEGGIVNLYNFVKATKKGAIKNESCHNCEMEDCSNLTLESVSELESDFRGLGHGHGNGLGSIKSTYDK